MRHFCIFFNTDSQKSNYPKTTHPYCLFSLFDNNQSPEIDTNNLNNSIDFSKSVGFIKHEILTGGIFNIGKNFSMWFDVVDWLESELGAMYIYHVSTIDLKSLPNSKNIYASSFEIRESDSNPNYYKSFL